MIYLKNDCGHLCIRYLVKITSICGDKSVCDKMYNLVVKIRIFLYKYSPLSIFSNRTLTFRKLISIKNFRRSISWVDKATNNRFMDVSNVLQLNWIFQALVQFTKHRAVKYWHKRITFITLIIIDMLHNYCLSSVRRSNHRVLCWSLLNCLSSKISAFNFYLSLSMLQTHSMKIINQNLQQTLSLSTFVMWYHDWNEKTINNVIFLCLSATCYIQKTVY